ncbi:MAG: RNase P subunit p30 family protein [Candidatus Undinarchaeales archaeon]
MYDLHNTAVLNGELNGLANLGVKGLGIVFKNNFNKSRYEKAKEKFEKEYSNIDLISAVEITKKTKGKIKTQLDKVRNQVDIVFVSSRDDRAMRAAPEMKGVDIISHAFVDQSAARDCADNNIALEINLKDILSTYGMKRANLISKIKFDLRMARKYNTPLIFTSGASDMYGMRSPKQLVAFAESIGFKPDEAKKAVLKTPKKIVERNRKRKGRKSVGKGVKKI